MTVITASYAQKALIEAGYPVKELHTIEEGSNHFVFIVVLHDTSRLICKFAKVRKTEQNIGSANRDTLFGGLLSLEREAYLFSMIRDKAEVPTPKVYGIHRSEYGTFIVLEYMTGISQKEYMKQSGYSKQAFLNSMEYLGRDFAKIQQVTFPSFGNIMENSIIDPSGLTNFSDRFRFVIQMRLPPRIQKNPPAIKGLSPGTLQKHTSFAAPIPSRSAVSCAAFFIVAPILSTASMFMPAFELATFTDEQILSVFASASGMLSIRAISPFVQPFSTRAPKPPIKFTPTSCAALSRTFARYT